MDIIDWVVLSFLGVVVLLINLVIGLLPAVFVSGSRLKLGCIGLPVAAFCASLSGLGAYGMLDISAINRDYGYYRYESHSNIVMTISVVFGAIAFMVAFLPSLSRIVANDRDPWGLPAGTSDSSSWLLSLIAMNAAMTSMNVITDASIMNNSTTDFSSFNQPPSNF